jgi:hypothetical protein
VEQTGSPIVITMNYESGGDNYVFADMMQVNRPALLLENGYLYIAFGSNGVAAAKRRDGCGLQRCDAATGGCV